MFLRLPDALPQTLRFLRQFYDNPLTGIVITWNEENITHKYPDAVVIEMLAVCGALQTQIFEQDANVKRIRITGPGNGANCIITFDIL